MSALIPLLEAPYQTIDDVVGGIAAVERHLLERRDRRAVFASAYLAITLAVRQGGDDGAFGDDDWVRRYDVAFAHLYRAALLDFERVPRAWRFSFETSLSGDSLVLQDLLLGINAHINHDLALALFEVSVDPRDRRHADHTEVNEVLAAAAGRETTLVQELALAMNARLDRDLPLALVAAGMDGDRERRHRDLLAFHELRRPRPPHPPPRRLGRRVGGARALLHVEDRFEGRWSAWVEPAGE